MRFEGIQDPQLLERAGRLLYLEGLRAGLAARFADSILRWSVTANVAWELVDRGIERRVVEDRAALNEALLDRDSASRTYDASGPERDYASAEARYRDLADYWKNTSMLLAKKAEAYGFRYFHFLQPNQYVKGSKPMGEEERAIALPATYFYKQGATEGYPHLIAAGKEMTALGMPFADLTMMFHDVEAPVYSDGCCHFNAFGNELIAQEMARGVGEAFAKQPWGR